ncbi:putative phosphonate ABC transporter, inner membrane subunit [Yersinia pestis]|nr:putative phosphonate ABC transporter, inner membrane subunit [Yersinia pestis]
MLTHHLTTEQILTLKQQNPQLFRQQKRYIRLIAIITAAIFLYYLFFFTVFGIP